MKFKTLKEKYKRYLETYKNLNNGSLEGAVDFYTFYIYLHYTCRYADPRSRVPIGYR